MYILKSNQDQKHQFLAKGGVMKKIIALVLAIVLLLSLVGCQGKSSDDGKVKLKIYTQYSDDDSMVPYDYAVEQLAMDYPNVELELVVQAQDDGATLKTLAGTGQLPDIYQANTNIIQTFRTSNQIMVLNDVAKETGFADKLFDSTKSLAYSDDGNMYVFPFAGHEYVLMYYNKALFEKFDLEVPKTYDELIEVSKVFNKNDILPISLFAKEGWNCVAVYDSIATKYEVTGVMGIDDGAKKITDSAYLSSAKDLAKLVENNVYSKDATSTNYDSASAKFLSREAAIMFNGQWYIQEAVETLGDDVDWMFYPAKDLETYEATKYNFSGGGSQSGFAVNPDSKNAELAAEIASYMAEKYCEAKVKLRANPLVAIETEVTSDTELPAMMQKLVETIPSMTGTTKFQWGLANQVFNTAISTYAQGVISGEYTPEEFIDEIEKALERAE